MARVALDADVVIAFLDAGDEQHERAVDLLRPLLGGGTEIAIGASVYAEVMVRPLASGTGGRVDEFIDAIGATVLAIDRELARRAAELRARHRSVRLADALSLATAITAGAELLTFDQQLRRVARREQEAEYSSAACLLAAARGPRRASGSAFSLVA